MGGGKSKTYRDLDSQQIFNQEDDLYNKELLRMYALYLTVDAGEFLKDMIISSRQYFNAETFEKMGVATKITADMYEVIAFNVSEYIYNEFGHDKQAVFYYTAQDSNNQAISINAKKIHEKLSTEYNTNCVDFTKDFTYSYTIPIQDFPTVGCLDESSEIVYENLFGNSGPDNVTITYTTCAYEINPGEWYALKSDFVNEYYEITLTKLDDSWAETDEDIQLFFGSDNRVMYIARYATATQCAFCDDYVGCVSTDWYDAGAFVFYKDEIALEVYEYRFLMFPIKDGGEFIDEGGYKQVMLQSFGLGNGELEDSLGDSEVKAAMLTYSTNTSNEDFKEVLSDVYGTSTNPNEVVFSTPYYTIAYTAQKAMCDSWDEDCEEPDWFNFYIHFEGHKFAIGDKLLYMIPVDNFNKMPYKKRYKFLKETFCLWANSQETVKSKWYQTGLFKFATLIIAATLSILTQNPAPIMIAIGGQAVMALVTKAVGIEAAIAIAIVITIATGDFDTLAGQFATSAKIIELSGQVYLSREAEGLQEDIQKYNEKTEGATEAMEEMKASRLYVPYQMYDDYYEMNNVVYNMYDSYYDTAFDYEKNYKVNVRTDSRYLSRQLKLA